MGRTFRISIDRQGILIPQISQNLSDWASTEVDRIEAQSDKLCEDCGSRIPCLSMESQNDLPKIYSDLIEEVLNKVMVKATKKMVK